MNTTRSNVATNAKSQELQDLSALFNDIEQIQIRLKNITEEWKDSDFVDDLKVVLDHLSDAKYSVEAEIEAVKTQIPINQDGSIA